VADAVCYLFGYAGVIVFCTVIAPALMKIDLKKEALNLEQELGMTRSKPGLASAWRKFELRAYRLPEASALVGLTVAAAEARLPEHRLFILRLRRAEHILEVDPGMTLEQEDVIAISGPRQTIVELIGRRAEEVEDKELLDVPVVTADVLLMDRELDGTTLEHASMQDWTRGLYLRGLSRGGQDMPIAAGVALQRGDLLRIVGPEPVVQKAAARIGAIVAPSAGVDFVVLGLAIFAGGIIGILATFSVGNLKLSLGTSIGTLLAGLLVGHLRTRYPLFGRMNEGAVTFMTSLGLAAFVGLTGIHAGPVFLSALKEVGLGLLFGGMVVTLLPQIVGFLVGHVVLRMNPILLIGALTGSQTVTAAMAAVQERSGSPVAVLGYTPAYPVANILLTTWGAIVVLVIAS
jgi:putative transport protein